MRGALQLDFGNHTEIRRDLPAGRAYVQLVGSETLPIHETQPDANSRPVQD